LLQSYDKREENKSLNQVKRQNSQVKRRNSTVNPFPEAGSSNISSDTAIM
jgi:hypothetical protein